MVNGVDGVLVKVGVIQFTKKIRKEIESVVSLSNYTQLQRHHLAGHLLATLLK